MRNLKLMKILAALSLCAALPGLLHAQGSPQTPAVASGAYSTHHYRSLFVESGIQQEAVDERISASYQQLFHGDPDTEAILFPAGRNGNGPLAYVEDIANGDVRTEGMSYGMMLAVQLDHKEDFDALWNWAETHMRITDPENPAVGYFAWSMHPDGTPNSDGPAPDGEEYFVMSLYFAAHRWGNGAGIYNYAQEATNLLHMMRHHPVLSGTSPFRIHPKDPVIQSSRGPHKVTIGPMINEQAAMICFVPGVDNQFTDPSYQLPAFYDLWALWGPLEDRPFWAKAAEVSRKFFTKATNKKTGLTPDYADFDGAPRPTSFNSDSTTFANDSFRTASNWSVDQAWWERNPDAPTLSAKLLEFFSKEGVHKFSSHYTLDGKPLNSYRSTGLVATTAVAALALPPSDLSKAFVEEFWNSKMTKGKYRYYDGMLYMLSLLHASGQFKIY